MIQNVNIMFHMITEKQPKVKSLINFNLKITNKRRQHLRIITIK